MLMCRVIEETKLRIVVRYSEDVRVCCKSFLNVQIILYFQVIL